jgi:hypothetical protein
MDGFEPDQVLEQRRRRVAGDGTELEDDRVAGGHSGGCMRNACTNANPRSATRDRHEVLK